MALQQQRNQPLLSMQLLQGKFPDGWKMKIWDWRNIYNSILINTYLFLLFRCKLIFGSEMFTRYSHILHCLAAVRAPNVLGSIGSCSISLNSSPHKVFKMYCPMHFPKHQRLTSFNSIWMQTVYDPICIFLFQSNMYNACMCFIVYLKILRKYVTNT